MVAAEVELVSPDSINRRRHEIVVEGRRRRIWIRAHIDDTLADGIDQIRRDAPAVAAAVIAVGSRGNAKVLAGVVRIEWIPNRRGKRSLTPNRLGNRTE